MYVRDKKMSKNAKDDEGTLNNVLQLKKQVAYGFIDQLPKLPLFKKDIVSIILNYDRILNELPPIDDFERQFGRFSQSAYLKLKNEELEERYKVMDDCVYEHNETLKNRKKALSYITKNMTKAATTTTSSTSTSSNTSTSDVDSEKIGLKRKKNPPLFGPSPDELKKRDSHLHYPNFLL